eukprot:1492800-Amphidinium_carterae.1
MVHNRSGSTPIDWHWGTHSVKRATMCAYNMHNKDLKQSAVHIKSMLGALAESRKNQANVG